MSSQLPTVETKEQCQGSVERIVFFNEENGFVVARLKTNKKNELLTIVGTVPSLSPGEFVQCQGQWFNDPNHGLQFKAETIQVIPPSSLEGIKKYLSSGIVKGIGAHYAELLINAFGKNVLEIMDNEPNRLLEIPGIGKQRLEKIVEGWTQQKSIRDIILFLQQHGIGNARAMRIYKAYGEKAVEKIKANPFRLADEVYGIGFKTADALAQQLGIAADALVRIRAALRFQLQMFAQQGHCAIQRQKLIETTSELLQIEPEKILPGIEAELTEKNIIAEKIKNEDCLFLTSLHRAEVNVLQHLIRLKKACSNWLPIDALKAIPWVEEKTKIELSYSQKQAVIQALENKVLIITGGPGVGKTTVVNSILQIARSKRIAVTLCAPTGRAAKRLAETTNMEAKTIHRLLGKKLNIETAHHDLLKTDLVIVDETSMIDIVLMQHLLAAIPDHASVIFVGDVDQLPSVGPGSVLADFIDSDAITCIRLNEIFRQARTSKIILNAHRVNEGKMPLKIDPDDNEVSDFYFIAAETPEEIEKKLLHVVIERIPKRFGFDPIFDIQVLTPMNRNQLGARALNQTLQQHLNKNQKLQVTRFGNTFSVGDKVIQLVNNYDKEVFNGDIGFIHAIHMDDALVEIAFEKNIVRYDFDELDEINLAYAVTIHKSQGSEYPVVVIPIATQHFTLLEKNLVYTAITRGKKLVVLIGQKKALAIAVNTKRSKQRITKLQERLSQSESL